MHIDFKIVSYHRLSPEQVSEFTVEEKATFGRANSCDWHLPDPEKVISSSHVRIEKEEDNFYLIDTSTNGVFINRSVEPVGKGNKYLLCTNDLLAVGDYEITVEVVSAKATNPQKLDSIKQDVSPVDAFKQTPVVDEPVEFLAQDILGEPKPSSLPLVDNDLKDAFVTPEVKHESAIPEDWDFGLSDKSVDQVSLAEPESEESAPVIKSQAHLDKSVDINKTEDIVLPEAKTQQEEIIPNIVIPPVQEKIEIEAVTETSPLAIQQKDFANELHQKVPTQMKSTRQPLTLSQQGDELAMFLKGLGLSDKISSDGMSSEVYFELGQSMNLMFMGLIKLLRNRSEIKSEFKINQTTFKQQENNPLKFSATIDDVFNNLYLHGSSSFLSPKKAIQDAFQDTEKHEKAFSAGTLGALVGILNQLDPEKIQQNNIQPHYLDKLIPAKKEARNWELFAELHDNIKAEISTHGSGAITDDFVKAYDKKIRNL